MYQDLQLSQSNQPVLWIYSTINCNISLSTSFDQTLHMIKVDILTTFFLKISVEKVCLFVILPKLTHYNLFLAQKGI